MKKAKEGPEAARGACSPGGMSRKSRGPFFVGDFQMDSMSRKGRLVIFLMHAGHPLNDGEVEGREPRRLNGAERWSNPVQVLHAQLLARARTDGE